MYIHEIEIENIKNFNGKFKFILDKINVIKGQNGAGKSTLALSVPLFCFYGYSDQSLDNLPTRNIHTKCKGRILFTLENSLYEIIREYPTKLTIFKDKEEIVLPNNLSKQQYLNNLLKNVDYFRKFRLIDNDAGINILEEGRISLQKTLLSLYQDTFNSIRQSLLDKEKEYKLYNKDKVVYSHYPSEIRKKLLEASLANIEVELRSIDNEITTEESKLMDLLSKKSYEISLIDLLQKQINKLSSYPEICPICNQSINKQKNEFLINENNRQIAIIEENILVLENQYSNQEKLINTLKLQKSYLINKKSRLNSWYIKLETRLKQKDFKYTDKDIFIVQEAKKELEYFYNYYISSLVKVLEPIINSIIEKIGFSIKFTENFDLILYKDKIEYTYKDLSKGQKLLLSLAFKIALLMERGEEGVIIVDEGFSSLSENNLSYVMSLFNNISFQLIAVSHMPGIENMEGIKVIQL